MLDSYIQTYGKRLFGLCITLCGNPQNAEDLYQETWLRVLETFHRYHADRPFEPWLTRICVNLYRDQLRHQKTEPARKEFADGDENSAFLEQIPEKKPPDYAALHEAIDKLPLKLRTAVILFYFHELDLKQAAAALRIPQGTLKSRLHNARILLRKELEHEPNLQF